MLFSLVMLSACGYHFTPAGGIVPESAKTVAIPVFINKTFEPYIDVEVTKAVVDEFLNDGRLSVVSLENADMVLRGSVTTFELTPTTYTADSYVASYSVSIGVTVSVEDQRTGKILLADAGLGTVFLASYSVSLNPGNTQQSNVNISRTKIQKETAVINACKDLASSIRSRVLEGF